MERKPGFRDRITQAEFIPYKPTTTAASRSNTLMMGDYDWENIQAMDVTGTFPVKTVKTNAKEMLHGLNDRFASFIEKVRRLEHQNELLEREIEGIKQKEQTPASLQQTFGPELEDLRKLLHDITHQKHQIEVDHQNLKQDLFDLTEKYETEARIRADTETTIVLLKGDIDDAYQAKLELDKKSQAIADEIDTLKKNHDSEVSQLIAKLNDAQEGAFLKASEFGCPELTAALRDIRAQLEDHAVSDLHRAEESFHIQVSKLTEAAETKREALKASKQEIQEYRKRLQSTSVELDCVKGTREALERQLREIEECHNEEIIHYQDTIKQLENELMNIKFDMSSHLREYHDLLNVKMALDVEILSYRKLLEGEESRLSAASDAQQRLPAPYIYRQSPVYTLPCLGQVRRTQKPQYKFVEEIITETTREIEMSEFEETSSEGEDEEMDRGDHKEGHVAKSESGRKRKDEEEGEGVEDSPEEEGVPERHSEQHPGVEQEEDEDEGVSFDEETRIQTHVPMTCSDGGEESSRVEETSEQESRDMEGVIAGSEAADTPEAVGVEAVEVIAVKNVASLKPESDTKSDLPMEEGLLKPAETGGSTALSKEDIKQISDIVDAVKVQPVEKAVSLKPESDIRCEVTMADQLLQTTETFEHIVPVKDAKDSVRQPVVSDIADVVNVKKVALSKPDTCSEDELLKPTTTLENTADKDVKDSVTDQGLSESIETVKVELIEKVVSLKPESDTSSEVTMADQLLKKTETLENAVQAKEDKDLVRDKEVTDIAETIKAEPVQKVTSLKPESEVTTEGELFKMTEPLIEKTVATMEEKYSDIVEAVKVTPVEKVASLKPQSDTMFGEEQLLKPTEALENTAAVNEDEDSQRDRALSDIVDQVKVELVQKVASMEPQSDPSVEFTMEEELVKNKEKLEDTAADPEAVSNITGQDHPSPSKSELKEASGTEPIAISPTDTVKRKILSERTENVKTPESFGKDSQNVEHDTKSEDNQKEETKQVIVELQVPMEKTPLAADVKELQQEKPSSTGQKTETPQEPKVPLKSSGEQPEIKPTGISEEGVEKTADLKELQQLDETSHKKSETLPTSEEVTKSQAIGFSDVKVEKTADVNILQQVGRSTIIQKTEPLKSNEASESQATLLSEVEEDKTVDLNELQLDEASCTVHKTETETPQEPEVPLKSSKESSGLSEMKVDKTKDVRELQEETTCSTVQQIQTAEKPIKSTEEPSESQIREISEVEKSAAPKESQQEITSSPVQKPGTLQEPKDHLKSNGKPSDRQTIVSSEVKVDKTEDIKESQQEQVASSAVKKTETYQETLKYSGEPSECQPIGSLEVKVDKIAPVKYSGEHSEIQLKIQFEKTVYLKGLEQEKTSSPVQKTETSQEPHKSSGEPESQAIGFSNVKIEKTADVIPLQQDGRSAIIQKTEPLKSLESQATVLSEVGEKAVDLRELQLDEASHTVHKTETETPQEPKVSLKSRKEITGSSEVKVEKTKYVKELQEETTCSTVQQTQRSEKTLKSIGEPSESQIREISEVEKTEALTELQQEITSSPVQKPETLQEPKDHLKSSGKPSESQINVSSEVKVDTTEDIKESQQEQVTSSTVQKTETSHETLKSSGEPSECQPIGSLEVKVDTIAEVKILHQEIARSPVQESGTETSPEPEDPVKYSGEHSEIQLEIQFEKTVYLKGLEQEETSSPVQKTETSQEPHKSSGEPESQAIGFSNVKIEKTADAIPLHQDGRSAIIQKTEPLKSLESQATVLSEVEEKAVDLKELQLDEASHTVHKTETETPQEPKVSLKSRKETSGSSEVKVEKTKYVKELQEETTSCPVQKPEALQEPKDHHKSGGKPSESQTSVSSEVKEDKTEDIKESQQEQVTSSPVQKTETSQELHKSRGEPESQAIGFSDVKVEKTADVNPLQQDGRSTTIQKTKPHKSSESQATVLSEVEGDKTVDLKELQLDEASCTVHKTETETPQEPEVPLKSRKETSTSSEVKVKKTKYVKELQEETTCSTVQQTQRSEKTLKSTGEPSESQIREISEVEKTEALKELQQDITSSPVQKPETLQEPKDHLKSSGKPSESQTNVSSEVKVDTTEDIKESQQEQVTSSTVQKTETSQETLKSRGDPSECQPIGSLEVKVDKIAEVRILHQEIARSPVQESGTETSQEPEVPVKYSEEHCEIQPSGASNVEVEKTVYLKGLEQEKTSSPVQKTETSQEPHKSSGEPESQAFGFSDVKVDKTADVIPLQQDGRSAMIQKTEPLKSLESQATVLSEVGEKAVDLKELQLDEASRTVHKTETETPQEPKVSLKSCKETSGSSEVKVEKTKGVKELQEETTSCPVQKPEALQEPKDHHKSSGKPSESQTSVSSEVKEDKTVDVKELQLDEASCTVHKTETETPQEAEVPLKSRKEPSDSQTSGSSEVKVEKTKDIKELQEEIASSTVQQTQTSEKPLQSTGDPSESQIREISEVEKTEALKELQQEITSSPVQKPETLQEPKDQLKSSGKPSDSQTSVLCEMKVDKTEDVKESQQEQVTSSTVQKTEMSQGTPKSRVKPSERQPIGSLEVNVDKIADLKELQQEITTSPIQKTETLQEPKDHLKSSGKPSESQTSVSSEVRVDKTEDVKESQEEQVTSSTVQKTETSQETLKFSGEPSECQVIGSLEVKVDKIVYLKELQQEISSSPVQKTATETSQEPEVPVKYSGEHCEIQTRRASDVELKQEKTSSLVQKTETSEEPHQHIFSDVKVEKTADLKELEQVIKSPVQKIETFQGPEVDLTYYGQPSLVSEVEEIDLRESAQEKISSTLQRTEMSQEPLKASAEPSESQSSVSSEVKVDTTEDVKESQQVQVTSSTVQKTETLQEPPKSSREPSESQTIGSPDVAKTAHVKEIERAERRTPVQQTQTSDKPLRSSGEPSESQIRGISEVEKTAALKDLQQEITTSPIKKTETLQKPKDQLKSSGKSSESQPSGAPEVEKSVDLKELEQGITSSAALKRETSHKPEEPLKSSGEPSESRTTQLSEVEKTKPLGKDQDISTFTLTGADDGISRIEDSLFKAEDDKSKPIKVVEAKAQSGDQKQDES